MAKSPSHGGEIGGFYLIFWRRNYPQVTGTRPPEGPRRVIGELARKAAEDQFNRERFIKEYECVYRCLVKDAALMQR